MNTAADILRVIARSVVVGRSGRLHRLPRDEMIAMARDFCDQIGVTYATTDLNVTRTDAADSAPKHENYRKPRSHAARRAA